MNSLAQERLNEVRENITKLENYHSFLSTQKNNAEKEEQRLRHESEVYQKCSEVFKTWLDDAVKQNVESISKLTTSGLLHVIHDQKLDFKIVQEMKYNRLSMRFVLEQDGVEGDPMISFGGGAAVLISMIMRLAVMARLRMANLLILDESLSSLANHYIPSAGTFMRRLSEQTGVNILMVTHNEEFLSHAHTAYEGTKDTELKLKKISSEEVKNLGAINS